jgi:hypothetical protein
MANRDMVNQSFSFEKHRKVVNARVSFGATGAPTLDGPASKGVLSIVRNSAGNYTIQFGVSVNAINYVDYYIRLLAIEWLPDVSYLTVGAPAAVGQPALVRNDLLSGANLTAPVQAATGTSTTGGTGLSAATTYYYVVTAVDSNGQESLASNEQSQLTGAGGTNSNTINWAVVPGAVGYRVYRGTATGAEGTGAGGAVYIVPGGASITFLDTGAASQASAAQPTIQARPPVKAGSLTIQTLNGSGVATDPASGEAVFLQFDFCDSNAP